MQEEFFLIYTQAVSIKMECVPGLRIDILNQRLQLFNLNIRCPKIREI